MTGGFATISGGLLAAYTFFGIPAEQLLAASVMSAPAALAVSKIVYPEIEQSKFPAGKRRSLSWPQLKLHLYMSSPFSSSFLLELAPCSCFSKPCQQYEIE